MKAGESIITNSERGEAQEQRDYEAFREKSDDTNGQAGEPKNGGDDDESLKGHGGVGLFLTKSFSLIS